VVGTAFGRITGLDSALGGSGVAGRPASLESAAVGVAVRLTGLRTKKIGGDCAPDDLLFVLPRERAWRLGEHRRRIETLSTLQTSGPPIQVPWEHSALDMASRAQAAFDRADHTQPERHAASAYERRWLSPAIAEFASGDSSPPRTFSASSRRDFAAPLQEPPGRAELGIAPEALPGASPAAGGRKHSREAPRAVGGDGEGAPAPERRRLLVVSPHSEGEEEEQAPQPSAASSDGSACGSAEGGGRGRRSRAGRSPLATGAWTDSGADTAQQQDFVYYADRRTWTEEADIDSSRLRSRWRERDQARWDEAERLQQLRQAERELAEAVRRQVFGRAPDGADAGEAADGTSTRPSRGESEDEDEGDSTPGPLPRRNVPVVPLILKTRSVSQFDLLMDELEHLEESYGVRIVIVHGGIGPVIPKDVVHAEVEKQHGFCPVYAFQVGATPEAAGQAEAERIDVQRFDVFTDLVGEVAQRCERLHSKAATRGRTEDLLRYA